ncbi:tRNA 2'-phosphotransferase [Cryptococcus neoformans]|uniref:2'-phosphotransferase n=1 Tax=Cryptococcus neoformans Tu259-1 TaxID=1230072 RepID=A0A854Q9J5_CRYNE|nr:tRNA 2'-phosphotransferase [Cryptococcus neoformans var. grubii AD1-83a]OWZ54215.1 tRNA 2'-phosphotransferase [Cryptococcus neoformans var. grubii 125.91]OXG20627.1 tRNA 2'-phosphotransferase [Cryptococcus neoformans var. grubii Tu259-1]OXG49867.1 tRNA 2'-phosphotransferase [Cryptococcus neoformans var. grubii Th84]OXG59361.1 tRNA 2'-phosphotransferase [Cryptococcus neoformans var. grubii MW-RSA1955]OXG63354.1 tRNA 2'-phosphotransferase [Cryptococcus neoformans var. grubii c8]OXG63964.1 tR
MPRPPEDPDVRNSKTLAYILRHGAEKEGLYIRSDGFIKLADVLARPKLKGVDESTILHLVQTNPKKRFELFWGYDPSPPRPKKKPTQGKTKKQLQRDREAAAAAAASVTASGTGERQGKGKEPDAAAIDIIASSLASTDLTAPSSSLSINSAAPAPAQSLTSVDPPELPLISLPDPHTSASDSDASANANSDNPKGEYFIRATQGHSIQLESTAHLEKVKDDEEGRRKVGLMVHGTRWELWDTLKEQGLQKMTRQHIHLAPSFSGPITPRPNATLYIYLDLSKLVAAGIPVYVSANGVVLTPGSKGGENGDGAGVGKEFWKRAVRRKEGKRWVVWEDGREVEREELPGEE